MKFKNVDQEVFKLGDIKTLVESIRIETNDNVALCFDLDLHAQRLLKSILELDFILPKDVMKEEFEFFLLNQVKNKLQYQFNKQAAFTRSEYDENLNMVRLSSEIYKLRIVYQKSGGFRIELDEYTRDLSEGWKVKILTKEEFHIESTNSIWQHKFLPRPDFSHYLNQGYDEVVWLDENEHICEASFTAILFEDGTSPKANTLPSTSLNLLKAQYQKINRDKLSKAKFCLTNSMLITQVDSCQ